MHAVAFSLIATAQHPELAWILVPFSGLIALSRVILGLHYPTDVLAGGVIGAYLASTLAGVLNDFTAFTSWRHGGNNQPDRDEAAADS